MKSPGRQLRALLKKQPVVMPGAYDALSALIIKDVGFDAGYLTGAGLSVSVHGKPDIGLLTLDEVTDTMRRIARAVDLPFLVDVDTGFGGTVNVERTVREMEKAGAAAIQIEDQEFPKRCGHLNGKKLISKEAMVEKIKAAVAARRGRDFLIVARTDARGVTGLRDAYARAQAYKMAGADIIFPEALESVGEFRWFASRKAHKTKALGVLMANMTEFGRSPALTVEELAHLGYRLILYPMTAFRVAAFAMERALHRLHRAGSTTALTNQMQTRVNLYRLNRYADFDEREQKILEEAKKVI